MVTKSIAISGIRRGITVYRDEWGIPAIFASNHYDLFFGYGYAVAEDRLFQMEITRRTEWGRMAEILGERFIESDKRSRILGTRCRALRKAKALSPYFREILEGFAAGINAYIQNHDVAARPGFRELEFAPEPWTLEDVMTCSETFLRFGLDMPQYKLLTKVGLGLARQLYPVWPSDTPVIVPESEMAKSKRVYKHLKEKPSPRPRGPAPVVELSFTGSNNCVVTGSKSATGKPILLGDPQQNPRIPPTFYEVVLHGGDFHCRGVGPAGIPGILVGFNRHAAWAATGLGGNRSELYEERLDPENPDRYLFRGRWEPTEKRTETMKVKNGGDVTIEVRSTHHGIICGELFGEKDRVLAFRHPAFDSDDTFALGCLRLNLANNYKQFRDAVSQWEGLEANLIYADDKGNIAYWPAGAFPVRPKGCFWGPVPGWTGEYEWAGYIPFDEKPASLNPDDEFIVTANNLIVGEWYPYEIITRAGTGTRFQRIREIILGREGLTQDDMEKIVRADVTCTPQVRKLGSVIRDIVARVKDAPPEVLEAVGRIARWDFRFKADSVAATIFDRFVRGLKESVFRPRLGDDFRLGVEGWDILSLPGNSPWFDDPATPEVETRNDVFYASFRRTVHRLAEELGPDQETWTWGRASFAEVKHQFAELGLGELVRLPDLGKFTMEGSAALTPHVLSVVSYSQIVDVTDMDKTRAVLSVGNSELYESPHSRDQIDLWRTFRLRPAYLSKQKLVAASKSKLLLRKSRDKAASR